MTAAIQIRLSDAHCPQKSSRSAGPEDDAGIREVRRAAACAAGVFAFLRAACQHVFFAKNPPTGELGTMQKYRNRERKAVRRLRRSGCSFLQACLPLCVLRKKLAGEPGAMRKYRNQERKSVHRVPCPGCLLLQVRLSTCGFPHKKIPRLSRQGIFIRHLR